MKIWQFDLDDEAHTLTLDDEKTPIVLVLNGKHIASTSLLTDKGQAYSFTIKKHHGRIQIIQKEADIHYVLLIDGKSIRTQAKSPSPSSAPTTSQSDLSGASIFRRRQQNQEQRVAQKIFIRQLIPDWTWVSIIGIMFIPAFGRLQSASLVIASIGIIFSIVMANLPHIKEIIRFSYTIMVMIMCWAVFIMLASRGIIHLENIPLF